MKFFVVGHWLEYVGGGFTKTLSLFFFQSHLINTNHQRRLFKICYNVEYEAGIYTAAVINV